MEKGRGAKSQAKGMKGSCKSSTSVSPAVPAPVRRGMRSGERGTTVIFRLQRLFVFPERDENGSAVPTIPRGKTVFRGWLSKRVARTSSSGSRAALTNIYSNFVREKGFGISRKNNRVRCPPANSVG